MQEDELTCNEYSRRDINEVLSDTKTYVLMSIQYSDPVKGTLFMQSLMQNYVHAIVNPPLVSTTNDVLYMAETYHIRLWHWISVWKEQINHDMSLRQ